MVGRTNLAQKLTSIRKKRWNIWEKSSFISSVCFSTILFAFRQPKLNEWFRIILHIERFKTGYPIKLSSRPMCFNSAKNESSDKGSPSYLLKNMLSKKICSVKWFERSTKEVLDRTNISLSLDTNFSIVRPHSRTAASERPSNSRLFIISKSMRLIKHLWQEKL